MNTLANKKLAVVTVVYWVLLLYMIAALLWWFIALNNQNNAMADYKLLELKKDDPTYLSKVNTIQEASHRKTTQYVGEGTTFLALILIGAVFVYRAIRKQLKFSQQQQNFMMAVTHELKTPIAVAKLNLETLQKRKLEEDQQQKLLGNTVQEVNRLNTLCNNILFAAQLESGNYTSSKQEINFSDMVEVCVEDFQTRFQQRSIITNIDESIYLNGEELLLQMLVNNLIENALKYSPKESPIIISLTENDHKAKLSIVDEGIGIAEIEKQKVFEKFYRTGDERTRKTKGTGLGLYLCKKIAEAHNGYISVTNNVPQGSNFAATFNI